MRPPVQIIAMGGGGFLEEGPTAKLDSYVLAQARTSLPNVLFIPTAGGDSARHASRYSKAFAGARLRSSLSFFCPPYPSEREARDAIHSADVIYVGGGNTRAMLAVWREFNLAEHILSAARNGTVLAGVSAGAICWFEAGHSDSSGFLDAVPCLGFLRGSMSPHYDGELGRRPSFIQLVQAGALPSGYGVDDNVALHFSDNTLIRAVSSKRNKSATFVSKGAESVMETRIEPVRL